jgi:TetR/AcrR family transcriptional regulator
MLPLRIEDSVFEGVKDERVTRNQLLDAASAAMIEARTPDVSLHVIARRAGLTAPLVKYYFGGKDGLLLALALRDAGQALRELEDLMAQDLPPDEALRLHVAGIVRSCARHPYLNGLLNLLLREEHSRPAAVIREKFIAPMVEAQRRLLEQGRACGSFRDVDPGMFYFVVTGACQHLFSTRVALNHPLNGAPADEKLACDYAAAAIDLIFKGLLKGEST